MKVTEKRTVKTMIRPAWMCGLVIVYIGRKSMRYLLQQLTVINY